MTSAELLRRLRADGWMRVHHKGSHVKFKHPKKPGIVTVPHPCKDFPAGTLRAIFKQAGWS